ncbi:ribosomal rna-processing protein 7 [Citrus sinensis]|uniref:Ribosomal rna-processing protein 7 n=1 Tax=Citrus sinensis TaxID=2711 RepID=A0ACB8K4F6_CITSI|nr:ribosomal rna-processing protein 7 [Citrus sinensis]
MGSAEKKQRKKKPNLKKRKNSQLSETDENLITVKEDNEQNKPSGKKKIKREKGNSFDVRDVQDNSNKAAKEKKRNKSKKKLRREEKSNATPIDEVGEHGDDADNSNGASQVKKEIENPGRPGKSKKARKKKKKDRGSLMKDEELEENTRDADEDDVYMISSGDEHCSKGMKKWVTEYHQSRPGLKVLQQRIDEFITAHEAKLEQERKEREARAAEGGWTVVVHHKGRKKTTDAESGIAVGSVAQAAVEDKMAKKKKKDVGLDFYRFQRREAKRNGLISSVFHWSNHISSSNKTLMLYFLAEIMLLQSKFEQDRKRIQQLRAARKFKPY